MVQARNVGIRPKSSRLLRLFLSVMQRQTDPGRESPHQAGSGGFNFLSGVFVALLLGICILYFYRILIHHDVAYFLVQSQRMAAGDRLYVDIVDFNPPMIHLWALPPVLISEVFGWSIAPLFYLYVSLALVGSAWLCSPMMTLIYPQLPSTHRIFLIFGILFCLFPLALEHFGQREHLFFAFFLPYLFQSFACSSGRKPPKLLSLVSGILAAIGLCFKPYFVLPFMAVELFVFSRQRASYTLRRWDLAGLVCVLAVYVGTILIVFPRYLDCVRLAQSLYAAYDTTVLKSIAKPQVYWFAPILPVIWIFKAPSVRDRSLYLLLAAVMGAFLLMAVVQKKGWDYQYYPLLALEAFFVAVFLVRQLHHWGMFETLRLGIPGVLLLSLCGFALSIASYLLGPAGARSNDSLLKEYLLPAVSECAKGRPMYVLSTSLYPGWTMVLHSGARWPYRHASLWFLPEVYRSRPNRAPGAPVYNEPGSMPDRERLFYSQVVEDLIEHPPSLLMIDKGIWKQGLAVEFDYEAYFRQDSSFSRLLAGYRCVANIAAFDLYVPSEPSAAAGSHP